MPETTNEHKLEAVVLNACAVLERVVFSMTITEQSERTSQKERDNRMVLSKLKAELKEALLDGEAQESHAEDAARYYKGLDNVVWCTHLPRHNVVVPQDESATSATDAQGYAICAKCSILLLPDEDTICAGCVLPEIHGQCAYCTFLSDAHTCLNSRLDSTCAQKSKSGGVCHWYERKS